MVTTIWIGFAIIVMSVLNFKIFEIDLLRWVGIFAGGALAAELAVLYELRHLFKKEATS